jgi:hypothetical protein
MISKFEFGKELETSEKMEAKEYTNQLLTGNNPRKRMLSTIA